MKKIFIFLLVFVSNCFPQYNPQFNRQPSVGYQINLAHPDARGLLGAWLFNEGSGLTLFDLSPHYNDGTLTLMDESDWVGGNNGGYALDFDGTEDFTDVLNIPDDFINFPATVVVWFKCDILPSVTADEYTLFRYATAANNTVRWQIRIDDDDDKIEGTVAGGASKSTIAITAGKWHQAILVSRTSTNHQVYLDATPGGTSTSAFPDITTGELRFGVNYFSGLRDYMLGNISSVILYSRALSDEEIMSLYTNPYAMFEQPPGRILAAAAAAAARRRNIIVF